MRARRDALLGWCAWAVRRSGLWRIAGFASFSRFCKERLGLSARTVEQRAALERRLWQVPALRAARDAGLSYERLRILARLPDREIEKWVPRARTLTCVELRAAVEDRGDAQMRAARVLRARVPARVALLLQAAFRAVRATEGRLLDDGRCLVLVARHFIETWRAHVRAPRTLSQRVRERDLGRCRAPGCSRRAVHAHHVVPRSRGGGDEPENLAAICACVITCAAFTGGTCGPGPRAGRARVGAARRAGLRGPRPCHISREDTSDASKAARNGRRVHES